MKTIGAFEAKTHFAALLKRIEKSEEIIITKHGHPIAKLIPFKGINQESAKEAVQRLKNFSTHLKLGGLDWKALRDEGRR